MGASFKFSSGSGYTTISAGGVYQFDLDIEDFEFQGEANYNFHTYNDNNDLFSELYGDFSFSSIDFKGTAHYFPIEDNGFFLRGGLGLYTYVGDWTYTSGLGYHAGLGYKVAQNFSLIGELGGIGFTSGGIGLQYIF